MSQNATPFSVNLSPIDLSVVSAPRSDLTVLEADPHISFEIQCLAAAPIKVRS